MKIENSQTTALTAALTSMYVGKIVYHNYGQIGHGVVTGIDDRDPSKPRLRVKFARHETPKHRKVYNDRASRVRSLLPQSVTLSTHKHAHYNESVKMFKA